MPQPSTTPLLDRLDRIRANKDRPSKFATLHPVPMSPYVRAAREGSLRPMAIGYSPDGCGPTGRAA
jgi:hypothetical protein